MRELNILYSPRKDNEHVTFVLNALETAKDLSAIRFMVNRWSITIQVGNVQFWIDRQSSRRFRQSCMVCGKVNSFGVDKDNIEQFSKLHASCRV